VLHWDNPIGKKFGFYKELGSVIGMVEDFHYYPLHQQIEPMAFRLININNSRCRPRYFSIKINTDDIQSVLSFIEAKNNQFSPGNPFEYSFFEDRVNMIYNRETKTGQLFSSFALLAILITCLGLFSLTLYNAEQKAKEIGIRKVFGSQNIDIILLLVKDYVKVVLLANLIALPIAFFTMNKWLQNFAYKISIGPNIFIISSFMVLLIVLITISYQTIKSIRLNPVDLIKCE
jgi:putative ABC transport system permease protein